MVEQNRAYFWASEVSGISISAISVARGDESCGIELRTKA